MILQLTRASEDHMCDCAPCTRGTSVKASGTNSHRIHIDGTPKAVPSFYQRLYVDVQVQVIPSLCLFVDLAVHWLRAAYTTSRQLYDTCHLTAPTNLRLRQLPCERSRRLRLRRVQGLTRSHGGCQVLSLYLVPGPQACLPCCQPYGNTITQCKYGQSQPIGSVWLR